MNAVKSFSEGILGKNSSNMSNNNKRTKDCVFDEDQVSIDYASIFNEFIDKSDDVDDVLSEINDWITNRKDQAHDL